MLERRLVGQGSDWVENLPLIGDLVDGLGYVRIPATREVRGRLRADHVENLRLHSISSSDR